MRALHSAPAGRFFGFASGAGRAST